MENQRVQIQVWLKHEGLNGPERIYWITFARGARTDYLQSANNKQKCNKGIRFRKMSLKSALELLPQPWVSSTVSQTV